MNRNNFDGVRIGLALIVVFFHLSVLTELPELRHFRVIFSGEFAVKGFFAISGFLVMKSYLTSSGVIDYFEKRARRIYPAYLSAVVLCLVIGSFVTRLDVSDFFRSAQTAKYLVANAAFLNFLQPTLPEVFDGNPSSPMNGSLWTIKIEVMLYFCIPFIYLMFKALGRSVATALIIVASILWVYFFTFHYDGWKGPELARQFPGQISFFVIGAFLSAEKKVLENSGWIAAVSLVLLFTVDNVYLRLLIDPICFSTVVIFLSTSAFRNLDLGRYGDISYGIYLYHFPIIQLLIFLGVFQANVWAGVIAAFAATIGMALLSWHAIEKRVLKRTSHYVLAAQGH